MKGWRFVVEIDYYPFSVPLQYNFNFTAVKIKIHCYERTYKLTVTLMSVNMNVCVGRHVLLSSKRE